MSLNDEYKLAYESGDIRRTHNIGNYISGWKKDRAVDELNLLENGFNLDVSVNPNLEYSPLWNVFYLIHSCISYNSTGYSTRTQGLLKNINAGSDYEMMGITRPGYPRDYRQFISEKLPQTRPATTQYDGVKYYTTTQAVDRLRIGISKYIDLYVSSVIKKTGLLKPCIIHAASNYWNGLTAIKAAKILGVKSVYEIRGLWEVTKSSRLMGWDETEQYQLSARLETQALQNADAAICITEAVKKLMVSRGVTREIHVVPNAVDIEKFTPQERDADLAASLGITDETVIGYVGSMIEYEGLQDLFAACRGLKNIKILIVGDGQFLPTLQKFAQGLDVIFTGRVPHEDVQRYISIMDIMPFPRKPYLVCDMVSPLKPFESLASKKAVIVSSCDALKEIIQHEKTGLVFEKGNTEDLRKKLIALINDKSLQQHLAENGYKWVIQNRSWQAISKIVVDIYNNILFV